MAFHFSVARFRDFAEFKRGSVLRLGNISGIFWKFSEIFPKISKGLEKLEIFGNLFNFIQKQDKDEGDRPFNDLNH